MDHSSAISPAEDIEKCVDATYLFYDQRVAVNRRINDRTLLGGDQ